MMAGMRRHRRFSAAGLAVVAMVAMVVGLSAGCSQSGGSAAPPAAPAATSSGAASSPASSPQTSTAATSSASAGAAAAVPAILDFHATTVDGSSFSGADLAGRKTVLWFWAPWCPVCARGAGDVKNAAATLGPDVTVIGVAGLSSDAADMRRFVERGGLQGMTTLADTTGDVYSRFGVTQQDTFVLVRPDGQVTKHPSYSQDVDLVAVARQTFG